VAELNRPPQDSAPDDSPASVPYADSGHPSVEQLMAEQVTEPITDVSVLHGDFWPEERRSSLTPTSSPSFSRITQSVTATIRNSRGAFL
jgi:hypothetical protein